MDLSDLLGHLENEALLDHLARKDRKDSEVSLAKSVHLEHQERMDFLENEGLREIVVIVELPA